MNHQLEIEQRYLSRTNRAFVLLIAAHIPVIAAVAVGFGTSLPLAVALGVAIAAGPAGLFWLKPGGRLTSIAAGVALMAMGALLVHAGRGMIELHFHFFVSLALLIVLGNPWVLLVAAGTVAVHHVGFWVFLPNSVFNYQAGFGIVLVHATFVVIQVVPSCFIARTLGRFVTSVTATVVTLRSSVDEVFSIATDLSAEHAGVAAQAAAEVGRMGDARARLEQMVNAASTTSQHASEVKRTVAGARSAAERGTEQMRQVGQSMVSLRDASAQVTQILRTIDGIAFQTNILALNAAVEAARAGDAGAGFAIVAGEVRALAQRVAQAARDTAEKVEDMSQKSESGVVIIDQATKIFMDIEVRVREVDALMATLAEASSDQAATAGEVSRTLAQVHEVVVSSARTAERTAGACQSLEAEACGLDASFEVLGALLGRKGRASADVPAPGVRAAGAAPFAPAHDPSRAA